MMDLALTCTPEILMLIPRRFPGPLAGRVVDVFFRRVQENMLISNKPKTDRHYTFHWVLFKLLLVLLHCSHTAGVNQFAESLQVSYGFVNQLRVSGDGFQPEHDKTS